MIASTLRRAINLACAALIALVALGDRSVVMELLAALPPGAEEEPVEALPAGSLTVQADPRGHFLLKAHVGGQPVRFLVDTGASKVVLSRDDAERLNLRVREGDFTELYSTPGGVVRAAPVKLEEVRIGALRMRNVRASVSERPMDISLLGMSFLERLAGYEVSRGRMVLRW